VAVTEVGVEVEVPELMRLCVAVTTDFTGIGGSFDSLDSLSSFWFLKDTASANVNGFANGFIGVVG
jgi:hypothetical protein